jgi:hypothetical protein
MDELEKHIRNGRDQMDIHDPDPSIWKKIEKDIPGREIHWGYYLWRAAVIVIIAGAGISLLLKSVRTSEQLKDPRIMAVQETYNYYNNQIKSLYEEAKPLLTTNPDISRELEEGLGELDSISAQIKKDLGDNIASEEVIEALIHNYRLRIDLLEDMLMLMKEKEAENKKNADHEL